MSLGWRPMRAADLPAVERIGDLVHPAYPEHPAVFQERLSLDPAGCLVLAEGDSLHGYAVSHRWRRGSVPALNSLLGALPADPDTRHVHDVAVLPALRGGGHGGAAVTLLATLAASEGLATLSLIAVGASRRFWLRHGFTPAAAAPGLSSYGEAATFMVRVA